MTKKNIIMLKNQNLNHLSGKNYTHILLLPLNIIFSFIIVIFSTLCEQKYAGL
jgi:hypothetical protein